MPLTFPSHPGLVLPLWAAYPRRFDAFALSVGSMLPDVLDLAFEVPTGNVSLNVSHSLLGLVALVIPMGSAVVVGMEPVLRALLRGVREARPPGRRVAVARWLDPWIDKLVARPPLWDRVLVSVAIGGASHLLFDAFTHRRFDWLLPWVRPDLMRPEAAGPWLGLWYRGLGPAAYSADIFEVMWLLLSIEGVLLFVWSWRKSVRRWTLR